VCAVRMDRSERVKENHKLVIQDLCGKCPLNRSVCDVAVVVAL